MDERKDSLKINIGYNLVYQIFMMLTPLISAPYIARLFEADGVGVVGYTTSVAAWFVLFAALGTAGYGQWMVAKNRDDLEERTKLFWEIEVFCIIMTAASLGIWFVVIMFLEEQYHVYYLILALRILAVAYDITWFYSGLEKFRFIVIRNMTVRMTGLVLLFTVIKQKEYIIHYILLTSVVELLGYLSMWSYLPRVVKRPQWKKLDIKRHVRPNLVFFIPTIATSVYNLADKTMLGAMTGEIQQNGYYEEANKVVGLAKAVLYAFTGVLSPRMSYLFAKERQSEFNVLLKKSMRTVLLLAVPMCFGIIAVGPLFVPLFFGNGYYEVIGLLRVASFLIISIGISNCLEWQFYTPAGKKSLSNRFVAVGALLNLVLNYVLIPQWKSMGAEAATLVTECVVSGLYLWYARERISLGEMLVSGWRYFAAGLVMYIVVSLGIGRFPGNWIVLGGMVCLGILVYFGCLLILRDDYVVSLLNGFTEKLKQRRHP